MKIISSFMDDLNIEKGKYHALKFESSYVQGNFRQLLYDYFRNKTQQDCTYLNILDENGDAINSKDFYFITFNCNMISLKEDKNTDSLLHELLFYQLENNPELLKDYLLFNEQLNNFISNIGIMNDDVVVDFEPSDKTIKNLIKSLRISVEYKESDYVPNYIMRDFLIKSLLKLNISKKDVFLLISFPETDIGFEDISAFITLLGNYDVTTLIITSHREFLIEAKKENMFLVDKNGSLYDILRLKQELIAFNLVKQDNASKIAKTLACHDFTKDYFLLNDVMREFLVSSRF